MVGEEAQSKYTKNRNDGGCRLIAMDTAAGVFHSDERPDPYVIRAKERAKSKIKTRIIGMNNGA